MTESAIQNRLPRKTSLQFSVRTVLAVATTVAILLGVAGMSQSHSRPNHAIGMWLNPFAACVAIYFWRFRISQLRSRRMRIAMFSVLVALTLPYIYWTGALIADWSRIPISKWLGDPLWVYTVPVLSFLALDLRVFPRGRRHILVGAFCELLVAIPVWTVTCLIWQGYFGWFQMG